MNTQTLNSASGGRRKTIHQLYRLCAASILAMGISAASMNDAHANRSQPIMAVAGQTSAPIGHLQFCNAYPAECGVKSRNPSVVTLTQESWDDLLRVNSYVNSTLRAVTDQDLHGKVELWTYPQGAGDCEEFVILKRRILMDRGWPASALLITVVREANGNGHAVLTVRTDRGDFILDNQVAEVRRWDETNYTYIKRQSEFHSGQWTQIVDRRFR